MKLLLVAVLLVSTILAGCAPGRIYTFQKDRVDQRMEGNRGYIMGTPPPAPVEREVPKRTLIGVDLVIDVLKSEEAKLKREEGPSKKKVEKVVVEEEEIEEEEVWVK